MSGPLIATKLYIPPARPEVMPRSRLTERLNEGLSRRLALVSAAAGFGKTTLVAEWAARLNRPVAWLSLDQEDNDPARFYNYLVAALETIDPGIGNTGKAMLQSPQPPPREVLLAALINDIAATAHPLVLVLDDYHAIESLAIHKQLGFLLQHQLPTLHLVIATREDPPLPLPRLRAQGQMMEIRQADLAFTAEEAAEFLRRMARIELSDADLAALQRRTEGWVAGLQLLALSITGRADAQSLVQAFTGSHRFVLDYLAEEVFERQSPLLQNFLLKTSILDRLSAPLCDALTGRDDGRDTLLALEHANLFLVPLDASREWFRYHRLFADLLRHRLRIESEQEVPMLHRKASLWYADNGFVADAVNHALAASDWRAAADMILSGTSDDLMNRGEVITLLGWLRAMPEEFVRGDFRLAMGLAWPLIVTEQFEAAESFLASSERHARERGDGHLLAEVIVARVHMARARGEHKQVVELSEQALALLPEEDLNSRCALAVNVGIAHWLGGRLDDAEPMLHEAERAGRGCGNAYGWLAAQVFLTRIDVTRGHLRQAEVAYRRIVTQGGQVPITGMAHYDLARLLYEWNDLTAALYHVEQGIELSRSGGSAEQEAAGRGLLALVKQAQREPAAATNALHEAARCLKQPDVSPGGRLYNLEVRIRVALDQGDLPAARAAAAHLPNPKDSGSFPGFLWAGLAKGRWLLAEGRLAEAAEYLAELRGMASRAGFQLDAIRTRALQALAAATLDEAIAILAEALALAESEGYIRAFLDAGEPMAALLREAVSRGARVPYASRLLAAFEGKAPPAPSAAQRGSESSTGQSEELIEPLSEREIDVLCLLARGDTNQEIARTLHISINTVKTHVSNIYGKLGVANRKDAATRAAALSLLR